MVTYVVLRQTHLEDTSSPCPRGEQANKG
ncbi:hypothetical protein GBAR_LOCUS26861 [Geodia barretti]|uniref:Uncharacterized protein n=1 Tax=Geodia barretti TaxID=519541 RepID=A0AA35TIV2_GEOBA|nr:hypothetical protein GBAR_LOCUS26861 [Geodia barretti]